MMADCIASGERSRLWAIAGNAVLRMVASSACIKKAIAAIHGSPAILRAFLIMNTLLARSGLVGLPQQFTTGGRGGFAIAPENSVDNLLMNVELNHFVMSNR